MPNIRDTLHIARIHSTRTHPNGPICVIPARRATQIFPQIFKHLCMYVLGWLLRSPFPSTVRSHLCHLATNPSLSLTHTIPAPSQKYKNTHTFWLVAPQSAMSQSVVCDRVWLVDYRNNKNTHKTADFPLSRCSSVDLVLVLLLRIGRVLFVFFCSSIHIIFAPFCFIFSRLFRSILPESRAKISYPSPFIRCRHSIEPGHTKRFFFVHHHVHFSQRSIELIKWFCGWPTIGHFPFILFFSRYFEAKNSQSNFRCSFKFP